MDVLHLTEKNQAKLAQVVASLLSRGGVVAVPTDTVYGLVADAFRESAVKKIFRVKVRAHTKALPVFVRDVAAARECAYIEKKLDPLLAEIWPGQTTVVFRKKDSVPLVVTGGERTVGLRVPDAPFMQSILAAYPHPLAATSANLSGNEAADSGVAVQTMFAHHIPQPDLIIDGGQLPASPPSTVIDLTNAKNPRILRMGAITKEKLDEILAQWNALL